MWQEGTGEKDFPVLRDSRSRYVERYDIIMMIYHIASSKFLWSENFRDTCHFALKVINSQKSQNF